MQFGLAAEQAKSMGLKVEVVVVGEDVSIEHPGLAGRRGLAGAALVDKVRAAVLLRCYDALLPCCCAIMALCC